MKKTISLMLCIVLALCLFTACANDNGENNGAANDVNVAISDVWADIEGAIGADNMAGAMDLDGEMLMTLYGIDEADLEEYYARMPMMNVHAEEFFIAKVKEGKMDTVKAGIEKRLADLDATWGQYLPDQYELVKNAQVIENGNYIMLVVSQHADKAVSSFNELTAQ